MGVGDVACRNITGKKSVRELERGEAKWEQIKKKKTKNTTLTNKKGITTCKLASCLE